MSLSLEVIGCSNAWAPAGGATSGYLVQSAKTNLLMDCGHGVLAALRGVFDPYELDVVALSHLHADHCADLIALAYMLRFHPDPRAGHRPKLVLPQGEIERLRRLGSVWDDPDCFEQAFEVVEIADGQQLQFGDLVVTAASVPHPIPTMAYDVQDADGARITYGADCSPNSALTALAADTGLLLAEATMPEPEHGHMSAYTAGQLAAEAKAQRCMLIHVCDAYDMDWVVQQGSAGFGAAVELAHRGLKTQVG